MYAVVFIVAKEGGEEALRAAGYEKREVWLKSVWGIDRAKAKLEAEIALRQLGVAQFAVTDYWGRGPG